MTWTDLGAEIAAEFDGLSGCYERTEFIGEGERLMLDHGSRFAAMKAEEAADPEWARQNAKWRDVRRRERQKADPEYAAHRRKQYNESRRRRRAKHKQGNETQRHPNWRIHNFRGQLYTVGELARLPEAKAGLETIRERIRHQGWDVERAVTTPPARKGPRARKAGA